jgi:pimeloyl-ACP methyl ester carboxylesterase
VSDAARRPREHSARIRGARLAWREWGEPEEPAVLALHGWLDNAASFDALAPLLRGCRVIAPDLPGNGQSDHRGPEGSYNIWDDLPDLVALTRELGLARYRLLGHSRGAAIATLLCAVEAEHISSLVLLDGLAAPPFDPADTVTQLRAFAHDYGAREPRAARVFATMEEAISARCRASGTDPRAVAMLVGRSLEACAGGYRWRTDARLRYASALKLSEPHIQAIFAAVRAPAMLVLAGDTRARLAQMPGITDWFPRLVIEEIAGSHHWHMLDAAPAIAACILDFWRKHDQSQDH